jgi:hypothetical protein
VPTATAQDRCLTRRGRFRRPAVARSPPGSRRVSLTTGSLCPSTVDSPIARPAVGTVSGACDDLAGRLVQFRHGRSRRGCRLDQVADRAMTEPVLRIPQRVVESPIQVGRTCLSIVPASQISSRVRGVSAAGGRRRCILPTPRSGGACGDRRVAAASTGHALRPAEATRTKRQRNARRSGMTGPPEDRRAGRVGPVAVPDPHGAAPACAGGRRERQNDRVGAAPRP